MVSRDTRVHLVAVALAFALLIAVQYVFGPVADAFSVPGVLAAAVFYGLTFAGAHLYLALRHDDGLVPPASRWRYVALVAVVVGIGVATALVGADRALLDDLQVRAVAWALVVVAIAGYLVVEARDGHRASVEA